MKAASLYDLTDLLGAKQRPCISVYEQTHKGYLSQCQAGHDGLQSKTSCWRHQQGVAVVEVLEFPSLHK